MNLDSKEHLNNRGSRLQKTIALFLRKSNKPEEAKEAAKPDKKFKIVKATNQERSSEIHRPTNPQSQLSMEDINPSPKTHYLGMEDKDQLTNFSFFNKFSESFNLMERFIKAQSANDLVIALCNLGKNLENNFQKERSVEMLKHLNSPEGRIFLKHKIDQIINDITEQILRDPHLNSLNSDKKGISNDDDLTKSEGNIATQNKPEETKPRDSVINSTAQKFSYVIELFDAFTVAELKHSARDLLLGMDKEFSERLKKLNPLPIISSDSPFMIIDTAQDPKKSGIESEPLIKLTSHVINLPKTLESFTSNYILQRKINPQPVDKAIQPYLNKLINELNYQYITPDSGTEFYLKAVQKGYTKEANNFLTRSIQSKLKAFVPDAVLIKHHTNQEEFDKFTDLMKWAIDKKFLPKPVLQKTLLSLISETNELKDDPEKLAEFSSKYKLIQSLFDKLNHHYTVPDLISADEIVTRFNNQQSKLEKLISETVTDLIPADEIVTRLNNQPSKSEESILEEDTSLLEGLIKLDPSKVPDYKHLDEIEKASEELPLPVIYRPSIIIDTAQDPKKSGIESEPLIKLTSNVINLSETLESFTSNYILQEKINPQPVDKAIQPDLKKLINEINYQYVTPDSGIEFYLKAVQKGYTEEANTFLTRSIQSKLKAFVANTALTKHHTSQEEFDAFTDLMKWAVDKKFLPKPVLQKTLLSLISETNELKDDPEKLTEFSSKYKLIQSLFDKLNHHYTVTDLISADEITRFNNQQSKLEKSIPEQDNRSLLERLIKLDASKVSDYEHLNESEKSSSEKLKASTEITPEILSGPESKPQTKTVPSREEVMRALKIIYLECELKAADDDDGVYYDDEGDDDGVYYEGGDDDDEGYDNGGLSREDYEYAPLNLEEPIDFLDEDEIPDLFDKINTILNSSLDQKQIEAMGIDLTKITSKDLELKSLGTVINKAFLEFKEERQLNDISTPIDFSNDEVSFDRFNNIVLKELLKIQQEQPNALRFVLKTRLRDLVTLDKDLETQDLDCIIDGFRLPEIFVNRETEFYKNAPNRNTDGSFQFIDDEKIRNKIINELINFFDTHKTLESSRELDEDSQTSLNEIIRAFGSSDSDSNDYFTTETDRIAFLYFSLLESNLKKEANIILYNSIADTLSENSKINNQRLTSLLPVLKYAKHNGYTENFKNDDQFINFDKFDRLLKYSLDGKGARKYTQKDCLGKINDPQISHQEILQSLELLYSNKKLNYGLKTGLTKEQYQQSLLKRLLPDEKLINSPLYLENNLPDLIRLATAGKRLGLLNSNNLETFKRQFQTEDLVRLTPTELVKDFFKNSSDLKNTLESSIQESFTRIKNFGSSKYLLKDPSWIKRVSSDRHLTSNTVFINDLESLVDKAFSLDNEYFTKKLIGTLREEIPSLAINPNNAAAHLSLLNCILNQTHDISNRDDNDLLKAEYSEYLDLPLTDKENPENLVDSRIMLIAKMEEALQSFEKFLQQNKTLKRDDFPQSSDSESILKAIGLPLYS
jgi:hypothetical protein